MVDFDSITKGIFALDPDVRSVTIGSKDGHVLHFAMRPNVQTMTDTPGMLGKRDTEVLLPNVDSYLDLHKKYFGKVQYGIVKFEKLAEIYMGSKNMFFVISVNIGANCEGVAEKAKVFLEKTLGNKDGASATVL